MLADSSKSCFEKGVTPKQRIRGSPGDGAIILTELGLEQSKTKRSLKGS